MGSVIYDTELMTNYVAGVPVAGGSHFATCLDPVSHKVVVFALSNDETPKLQMIKEDADGIRHAHDLTEALEIPKTTPIQTFELKQDNDLVVYLAVATKYDDKQSNLLLVQPFKIEDKPSLHLLPVKTVASVHRIYMTAPAKKGRYPMVFLTQQPLESITKASDIKRVIVSLPSNSWSTLRDMELPVNAADIFSIAPAYNVFGEGLFVLCSIKGTGERALVAQFVDNSQGHPEWLMVQLKCPAGARSLATFNDSEGYTPLLVACNDGIRHFTADQATKNEATGSLISSNSVVKDAERIVLAQDGEIISLWASNQKGGLSFVTTTIDKITQSDHAAIPLLDDGRANTFSACIARPAPELGRPNVFQAIIANDSQGNLTLLQQHRDTGIWKDEPFYVSYQKKNIKFDSHTVTIQLMHQGQPLASGQIYVSSSSATSALVNGKIVQLGSVGTWLSADEAGEVALIFSASNIVGQTLKLTQMRNSEGHGISLSSILIDPNDKVIKALGKLTSVKQLKEATTRSGKPLWDAGKTMPSDKDLETAVKCFGAISEAAKKLPKDGKPVSMIKSANMAALAITEHKMQAAETVGDVLMDGFYWVKQQVHKAVDWIVHKAGEVWHFVCTIGNAVKTFVLDCVEKLGEAATWVFDKIQLGWEKLKEFVGFLFSWDDILETKNTLSSIINSGLDLAVDEVDAFVPKVDDLFNSLKDQVAKALSPPSTSVSGKQDQASGGKSTEAQNSASFKWAGERLKNGGTGTGGAELKGKDKSAPDDSWQNTVAPLLTSINALATQTGNDIALLFKKQGSVTTEDLLTTGSHFLAGVLEVVKQFAISVIKLVKKLLNAIKDLGNAKIDLPIFTWLYHELTGHDLTLFDAVCLIIAIPATILIKAITGKAPPKIPNMSGKLLRQLITGSNEVSTATKVDFNTLTAGTMVSVVVVKSVFDMIELAYKSITHGADAALGTFSPGKTIKVISLVLDITGAIAAMPGDPKLPAPHLRQWITYLTLFRLSVNGIGLVIPSNEVIEKISACVNLAVTLANFGLYQAVYYYEMTEEWKDKDNTATGLCVVNNTLNAISGIGSFTANMGKLEAPHMTAVGVVVMTVGKYGLTVMEGFVFEEKYKKKQETRLVAPSF